MRKLKIRNARRQKVSKADTAYVQVKMTPQYKDSLKSFFKEFELETGQKLTYAYIFREGGLRFVNQLRAQLRLAKGGEFHAKKRNHNAPFKQGAKPRS